MITKLRLENWKTHKDSELEFDKGTNVLIGKMGSGKTSVIEAICYALFGTFPALNRKEVSIEEVIEKSLLDNTDDLIKKMLENGDIFQNTPGKVKVL